MSVVSSVLGWVCLLGGSFFILVGSIGLLRLPDFFTRMHAGGVTDTMGAGLILVGLMLQAGWTLVTIKLILVLGFMAITGPTATHALAKAALRGGVRPWLATSGERSHRTSD